MISERSLSAAVGIDENLVDCGKTLSVVDGTLLSELVQSNLSAEVAMSSYGESDMIDAMKIMSDSKRQDVDGTYPHDNAMEVAKEKMVNVLNYTNHLARSIAVKSVRDVLGRYRSHMETMSVDAQTPMMIVPNVYHDVWASSQLDGLVRRYENTNLELVKSDIELPPLKATELRQMLNTGLGELDELVADWYTDIPAEKLVHTYETVFRVADVSIGNLVGPIHMTVDGLDRNDILITFLIASNFEDHLPDGVNVSLEKLRNTMAKLKSQAGRVLTYVFENRERTLRNKALVYMVDEYPFDLTRSERTAVFVNNDVYLRYLKEGGTPEALMGGVFKDHAISFDGILSQKDYYETYWTRKLSLHQQRVTAEIFSAQREALRIGVSQYINEYGEEDEVEYPLPSSKEDLHRINQECIAKLQPRDFEDEAITVRRVVCGVLFANTNVQMVFDAMDTAAANNPGLSPRECALEANIDLIARWLASQIQVHYKKV